MTAVVEYFVAPTEKEAFLRIPDNTAIGTWSDYLRVEKRACARTV
jgi:hypothetical protein